MGEPAKLLLDALANSGEVSGIRTIGGGAARTALGSAGVGAAATTAAAAIAAAGSLAVYWSQVHSLAAEMYAQEDANLNAIAQASARARTAGGGNGKEPPDGPDCDKSKTPATSGETAATAAGREAHKAWRPPSGFQKEFRLPSGRRADAVNPTSREVIELKPNNPRAIREGQVQVKRYVEELEQMTGQKWTGRVETY